MTFDDPAEAVGELMDFFDCMMESYMDFNPLEYRLVELTNPAPKETISP